MSSTPATSCRSGASSLSVLSRTRRVDRLWSSLILGGGEPRVCGWLRTSSASRGRSSRRSCRSCSNGSDRAGAERAMQAMLDDHARLDAFARPTRAPTARSRTVAASRSPRRTSASRPSRKARSGPLVVSSSARRRPPPPRTSAPAGAAGPPAPRADTGSRRARPAAMPSIIASPLAGPSAIATAAARLSSHDRRRGQPPERGVQGAIWAQSVSRRTSAASSWSAAIAAWSWYGPGRRVRERPLDERLALRRSAPRPSATGPGPRAGSSSPSAPTRASRRASWSSIRASRPSASGLIGEQRRPRSGPAGSPRRTARGGSAHPPTTPRSPR